MVLNLQIQRCISFDSYIKPQPGSIGLLALAVVYLLTPTSNHNFGNIDHVGSEVVYLLTPTSNHNYEITNLGIGIVVYLLTPTSNHNAEQISVSVLALYIF